MVQEIRIHLVDDYELIRNGIKYVLEKTKYFNVVAESSESWKALADFSKEKPDIVLMGLGISSLNVLSTMLRMLQREPLTKIIVISSLGHEVASRAIDSGAKGFLSKHTASSEIAMAIRAVMNGHCYIDHETAQKMAMSQIQGDTDPLQRLSAREYEVFMQLAKGVEIQVIADAHYLSPKTIRSHKANIMQKLHLNSTFELICFAIKLGILDCASNNANGENANVDSST